MNRIAIPPRLLRALCALAAIVILTADLPADLQAQGNTDLDLAPLDPLLDPFLRVHGIDNDNGGSFDLGAFGVPVAAGADVDGDGFEDLAVAHFRASPLGRTQAGIVNVVLGNGTVGSSYDLSAPGPEVLQIYGAALQGERECAGSELWIDDVTGDGLGDVIICRQNLSLAGRNGAGAVTILVGSPTIATLAQSPGIIDLANPPAGVNLFTIIGPQSFGRLGIWVRTGDVNADGIADIVVGADREGPSGTNRGAVYVFRGGSHLDANVTVDLASVGGTALVGQVARIGPPNNSDNYHLGGTVNVGDLDGDDHAEVFCAATLNRAGASIGPFTFSPGSGGPPGGHLYVVWGDVFPTGAWPTPFDIDLETLPAGDQTVITGGVENLSFGEEIVGGLDYSGDGLPELFVGDLVGDGTGGQRSTSGVGYVLYDAAQLRGANFNIDTPPPGLQITKVLGPVVGAIGSDTVAHGDFNADGIGDLMIGNPGDDPLGRTRAGSLSIFLGQVGPWPAVVDTAVGAAPASGIEILTVQGADGASGSDNGDTLGYSASVGDLDGDARTDIVVNEMRGNGVNPAGEDSGNLIVISGALVPGGASVDFRRGDVTEDGSLDISDPIAMLLHLFAGQPTTCSDAHDANDDGSLNLADPIQLLGYLFQAGPPLAPPFASCGADPTTIDTLGCSAFGACP